MNLFLRKGKLLYAAVLALFMFACGDEEEVLPAVVASFTESIDQTTGTVTFTNTSENATIYNWNFGNGNTSTSTNPTQVYENGQYTVTLTASNVAGDSDTATSSFTIAIPEVEEPFDSGLLVNGDFEAGVEPWIGNAANVQEDGGNSFNFANVEAAGNPFDVNLSQVVALTQGTNYILTFDASSDRERTMLAGIGLNEAPFTNTNVEVNLTTTTQTFTLQLAATDFGGANSRVLFDMGAAVGTVVIDNVSLVEGGDGSDSNTPGGGGSGFDSGLLVNGDFEAGVEPWIGNAANVQQDGGNSFNFANVTAAGNVFDVNLSQVVAITQGTNYILTFDASSDRERTMLAGIGLNEAPFTNTSVSVNLTTTTQTFTLQLAANDFGGANSRVLFDMGGEVGVVVIDNVSLVEGGDGSDTNGGGGGSGFDSGLLTNGDFEAGVAPWIGNAANVVEEGGNSFNFANVTAAGNAFDVNLSQVVAITQGTNYILRFDASSDMERTMLAGIGLNEAPFTNTNVEVTLTTATQTFELQLAANDFGGANSRVLFDMGAAVGTVVIDNVSLVEGGDGSDTNGGTGGGTGGVQNFCNTQIQAFGGDAGSDIFLSIFNVNATTMRIEIASADSDPVDLLVLPAGAWNPNDAGISVAPTEVSAGVWAGEFFFPGTVPDNVELFIEWSKASFAGNWRSTTPGTFDTVAFNATCDTPTGGGSGGGTGGGTGGGGFDTPTVAFPFDFENEQLNFGAFENGATVANIANPNTDGNSSARVLEFTKTNGSAWFSGIFFDRTLNAANAPLVQAANGTVFTVRMWSPKAGIFVRMRLQGDNDGDANTPVDPAFNVDVEVPAANQWVTLTFDFTAQIGTNNYAYEEFVIQPDLDETNQPAGDGSVYYIDDIVQQ